MDISVLANMEVGQEINAAHFDVNHDGVLDIQDLPFEPGSEGAKLWFNKILVPYTEQSVTPQMREEYGDSVVGAYQGKPLVPGVAGNGQGDFDFLAARIHATQGIPMDGAQRIAGKAYWATYAGK